MARLGPELRPVARGGVTIEAAVDRVMQPAVERPIRAVDINSVRGAGQLKKHGPGCPERPVAGASPTPIGKHARHPGRLFVHFDHRDPRGQGGVGADESRPGR